MANDINILTPSFEKPQEPLEAKAAQTHSKRVNSQTPRNSAHVDKLEGVSVDSHGRQYYVGPALSHANPTPVSILSGEKIKEMGAKNPSLLKGSNGEYLISKTLEKGTFGKFRVCMDKNTKEILAIKEIRLEAPKNKITKTSITEKPDFHLELELMKKYGDLNTRDVISIKNKKTNKETVYVVQELSKGTLAHVCSSQDGNLKQQVAIGWHLLDSLSGQLMKMHRDNYIHCDVKPDNILIAADGKVHLSDFGLVKSRDELKEIARYRGSPLYFPPESNTPKSYNSSSADVWALGVTVAQVLTSMNKSGSVSYLEDFIYMAQKNPSTYKKLFEDILPEGSSIINLEKLQNYAVFANPSYQARGLYHFAKQDLALASFVLKNLLHPDPEKRLSTSALQLEMKKNLYHEDLDLAQKFLREAPNNTNISDQIKNLDRLMNGKKIDTVLNAAEINHTRFKARMRSYVSEAVSVIRTPIGIGLVLGDMVADKINVNKNSFNQEKAISRAAFHVANLGAKLLSFSVLSGTTAAGAALGITVAPLVGLAAGGLFLLDGAFHLPRLVSRNLLDSK